MFAFDIKLFNHSEYVKNVGIENCAELLISSKTFDSVHECEEIFSRTLSRFIENEKALTGKSFVIIPKSNEDTTSNSSIGFEEGSLCKFFVVDAVKMKQSIFDCSILGQIRTTV